ncbi:RadC family protein [Novosphingobium aquimarinum]
MRSLREAMSDERQLFDESLGGDKGQDAAHDSSGHRARLRKRLLEGGDDALADHEVIEFLLMGAVPRRDTKPLARALIARFGSLAGVLNADAATLRAHPGMGDATAAALKVVAVAMRRLVRQEVREKPVIGSWQALIDYLMVDMADLTHERVRVLYLNTRNMLILDEKVADGDIDEAAIHPRKVIHKAMDIGATALILVHNHPTH